MPENISDNIHWWKVRAHDQEFLFQSREAALAYANGLACKTGMVKYIHNDRQLIVLHPDTVSKLSYIFEDPSEPIYK